MAMISFSENHEEQLIAIEDGEPLASWTSPQQQGLKWAYSLGVLPAKNIIVLGLGAGFHLAALADIDPNLKITVIDTRPGLLRVFQSQFPQLQDRVEVVMVEDAHGIFKTDIFAELAEEVPYVVSFYESWGRQRQVFTDLFAHLTGRSPESVRYHLQELGVDMKAVLGFDASLNSIKDILPAVEASGLTDNKKQLFRVLGELVK